MRVIMEGSFFQEFSATAPSQAHSFVPEAPTTLAGRRMQTNSHHDSTRVSVAVVGTGMAGLVTAFLLSRDPERRFDVEVFEAQDKLSLDSASVTVQARGDATPTRVDQPMRAFDSGYYANLKAMYDHLRVEYISQRYLFTFSKLPAWTSTEKGAVAQPIRPYYIHSSNNHRIPPLRPKAFTRLQWISEAVFLAVCFAIFMACCFFVPPREKSAAKAKGGKDEPLSESLGHYLGRLPLPRSFVEKYLFAPLASMSTCTHDEIRNFPASDIISYLQRGHNGSHYIVCDGVQTVQRMLSRDLRINLRSRVTSVIPSNNNNHINTPSTQGVSMSWESDDTQTSHQRTFDHVILAVAPSTVSSIFAPLSDAMRQLPTVQVEAVVHTDTNTITSDDDDTLTAVDPQPFTKLYPTTDSQWIHLRTTPRGHTEAIHERTSSIFITNNPLTPIDSSAILSRTVFTRTLRTTRSREVVRRIFGEDDARVDGRQGRRLGGKRTKSLSLSSSSSPSWRNGDGNVWVVGSWCWDGMVLLEGCVVSSMRVADALGVPVPWRE